MFEALLSLVQVLLEAVTFPAWYHSVEFRDSSLLTVESTPSLLLNVLFQKTDSIALEFVL